MLAWGQWRREGTVGAIRWLRKNLVKCVKPSLANRGPFENSVEGMNLWNCGFALKPCQINCVVFLALLIAHEQLRIWMVAKSIWFGMWRHGCQGVGPWIPAERRMKRTVFQQTGPAPSSGGWLNLRASEFFMLTLKRIISSISHADGGFQSRMDDLIMVVSSPNIGTFPWWGFICWNCGSTSHERHVCLIVLFSRFGFWWREMMCVASSRNCWKETSEKGRNK